MAVLPDQLVELVRSGGSVSINAGDYLPAKLVEVVNAHNSECDSDASSPASRDRT